jgi:hypothetical protein
MFGLSSGRSSPKDKLDAAGGLKRAFNKPCDRRLLECDSSFAMVASAAVKRRWVLIAGSVVLALGLWSCEGIEIRHTSQGPASGYPGPGSEHPGGYQAGYQDGHSEGYSHGYHDGSTGIPFQAGDYLPVGTGGSGPYAHGRVDGYHAGYQEGFRDGKSGQPAQRVHSPF